jgi:hypothetical protein
MDRNDEYKIIEMIDSIIWRHASFLQDTYNKNRPLGERMHISQARALATSALENWMVQQLRDAHQDQP